MKDYQYAERDGLEIRIDFSRQSTSVDYRVDDDEWTPSPFQSAEFNSLSVDDVLDRVEDYLNSQG